jgi:hypothetical protein
MNFQIIFSCSLYRLYKLSVDLLLKVVIGISILGIVQREYSSKGIHAVSFLKRVENMGIALV